MPNTYACKGVFNPIFPPNSAKVLHFSAFHYTCTLNLNPCLYFVRIAANVFLSIHYGNFENARKNTYG